MNEDQHVEQVRDLFDRWARAGRAEGMERSHTPAAREAFERLDVQPGQHYLDIGCGNGYSVRWAAERDPSVRAVGLDVSEAMVARARELSTEHPNTRFVHAPFPLPMLKAKTFHRIFSMEVFYYMPDLNWAVLSAARLLTPGGLFACVVDHYEENVESHSWQAELGVPLHRLTMAQWRALMEGTGLEVVEQRQVRPDKGVTAAGSLLTLARRPLEPSSGEGSPLESGSEG